MVPGWVEWRGVLRGGFLVGSLLAAADCLPKVGHCYLYIMVGFHYKRFSLSLLV